MNLSKYVIALAVLAGTVMYLEWFATNIKPTHWGYAITVNFTFLAVATALMSALELPLIPTPYFFSWPVERDGRIYRWTGIRFFVTFLRRIGWERFWRKAIPVNHDVESLSAYVNSTRGAEAVHLVAGVLTSLLALSIAMRHSIAGTCWLWAVNILVNAYPVMLQRYNRPRAERVMERLQRAKRDGL